MITVREFEVSLPELTVEEVEHYRWLIGGLLDGSLALATVVAPTSAIPEALDEARELFDELLARIRVDA